MSYKAILIGASGLIGSKLLEQLTQSDQISEVLVLVRKALDISHPKIRQILVNFDKLEIHSADIQADIIFSCLGTTRTKTPDPLLYRKVDMDYPLMIAEFGLKNGASQFHIVSSLGANTASSNSYLKLKGELENRLEKLNYPSLHIYQPSYLRGERKERRIADKIMMPLVRLIDPLLFGSLKKYRSIQAETVAKAMLNQSLKNLKGSFIYMSNQIQQIA